jgi:hypothetical protein
MAIWATASARRKRLRAPLEPRPPACREGANRSAEAWNAGKAEQHARPDRERRGEGQHGDVKGCFSEARQIGRLQGKQRPRAAPREAHTGQPPERADRDALGEELPDDSRRARAHRCAHRELRAARVEPHEHQARDVRARHQQHEARGPQQQQQRPAGVADHPLGQRCRRDGKPHVARVVGRELGDEARRDGGERRLRAPDRDTGRQPRHATQEVTTPSRDRRWIEPERRDDVGHLPRRVVVRKPEVRRQHADDLGAGAVQDDLSPDDRRVRAEPAGPQPIADQGHAPPVTILFRGEGAAGRRHRTQGGKHLGGCVRGPQPDGISGTGEDRGADGVDAERGERRADARVIVEVLRGRERRPRRAVPRVGHVEHALLVTVGQRPQQRGVHDAEDGSARPDADRDGENRRGGERRALAQGTQSVAEVLEHVRDLRCQLLGVGS